MGNKKHAKNKQSEQVAFSLPDQVAGLLGTKRIVDKRDRSGEIKEWSYQLAEQQDNLHLAFYRFVPRQPRKGPLKDEHASKYLQALTDRWNSEGPWRAIVKKLVARQQAQREVLKNQGWHVRTLELETASRLISGLGYQNALEVGLTLHPLYGVPYLPGTAVKGVARAWAEQVEQAGEKQVMRVFGSRPQGADDAAAMQLGAVRFFDAFPTKFPKLEVDVMTPHYGPYYQDGLPPGDWHDPTPVNFLTVAPGQPFRFSLASRDEEALGAAVGWLRNGLRELGIGGKTSAGYGAFWSKKDRRQTQEALAEAAKRTGASKSKPDEPKWLETVGSNTTDIWAEVVDNSRRPLKVKIFVKDCQDKVFDCGGLRNLAEFPAGTRFLVRSGTYSKKKGLIDVTYQEAI